MPKLKNVGPTFRRTIALPEARKSDLKTIKQATGIKTDVGVINDALAFRAEFAGHNPTEMHLAIWLLNQIDSYIPNGNTRKVQVEVPAQDGHPARLQTLVMPRLKKTKLQP